MPVPRQVSFWNGPFLGETVIFGRAKIPRKKRYHWLNTANKSCHVKSERIRKWTVSYRAICVNIPLADNILHQFMRQIYANIPYHDCKSITVNWCKLDIVQVFVHQLYEHAANHHCLQLQWSLHLCCHILEVLRKRVFIKRSTKSITNTNILKYTQQWRFWSLCICLLFYRCALNANILKTFLTDFASTKHLKNERIPILRTTLTVATAGCVVLKFPRYIFFFLPGKPVAVNFHQLYH